MALAVKCGDAFDDETVTVNVKQQALVLADTDYVTEGILHGEVDLSALGGRYSPVGKAITFFERLY